MFRCARFESVLCGSPDCTTCATWECGVDSGEFGWVPEPGAADTQCRGTYGYTVVAPPDNPECSDRLCCDFDPSCDNWECPEGFTNLTGYCDPGVVSRRGRNLQASDTDTTRGLDDTTSGYNDDREDDDYRLLGRCGNDYCCKGSVCSARWPTLVAHDGHGRGQTSRAAYKWSKHVFSAMTSHPSESVWGRASSRLSLLTFLTSMRHRSAPQNGRHDGVPYIPPVQMFKQCQLCRVEPSGSTLCPLSTLQPKNTPRRKGRRLS